MSSLARTATRGAAVTLGAQLGRMVLQVGSVVVLSRVLLPSDYGLLAMTVAIVGVGELLRDFGLSQAAIQARALSRGERNNLWWTNTAIGALLGLACIGIAPGLAAIYDEPRLIPVTQALAITFLMNGAATQYRAGLTRSLRFRALAAADIAAPAVAFAAALVVALRGGGVWALVTQQLVSALALLVVLGVLGRWLPGMPDRFASIRRFVHFGGNLLGSQLVGYAANNIDSFLIGYRFGPTMLGYYNRAFQLLMTPLNQVRSPSTSVALPVLTRAGDDERFVRILVSGQLALCLPLGIALAVVVGAAEPAVEIFLGDGWGSVVPLLQLMAVAGLLQTLAFVGYWAYLARALTGSLLRYSVVSALIKVACIVVGSTWGLVGIAAGYAVAPALSWPISLWWLSRASGLRVRGLYAGAAKVLLVAVPAGAAASMVGRLADGYPLLQLLVCAAAGVGTAALVCLAVPVVRADTRQLLRTVRRALGERRGR